MEADDSAINVPAIAAAHVIKRYVAQAPDEISLEVSLSFLTMGDLITARKFEILIRVQIWPSFLPDANIWKLKAVCHAFDWVNWTIQRIGNLNSC